MELIGRLHQMAGKNIVPAEGLAKMQMKKQTVILWMKFEEQQVLNIDSKVRIMDC